MDTVSIPLKTLKWWRELVDLNPADLAPRMDQYLADAAITATEPVVCECGYCINGMQADGETPCPAAPRSDGLRDALVGLLAIGPDTEPLVAKAAWLRARAALADTGGA